MAETLSPISWVQDDPAVLDLFGQTEVDGTVFYVAGCEAFTSEQLGLTARPRAATRVGRSPWRDGVIPYRYVGSFTDNERRKFLKAAELWTAAAGNNSEGRQTMIFVEDVDERHSQYLRVKRGSGNNEASNGSVSSAYLKIAIFDVGSIAHELGHVLGLVHEHQRHDRDHYVAVSAAVAGNLNFRLHGAGEDKIRTEYDFGSIMHYGSKVVLNGVSVDALIPKPGYEQDADRMGQRVKPSPLDVQAIRTVYA